MTEIDEIDARIANESLAEYEASGKKSRPIDELWKEVGLDKKKRGRPRNDNKVHSIRCSDVEYLYLKECLKRYRERNQSEAKRIKALESAGQKKLKF